MKKSIKSKIKKYLIVQYAQEELPENIVAVSCVGYCDSIENFIDTTFNRKNPTPPRQFEFIKKRHDWYQVNLLMPLRPKERPFYIISSYENLKEDLSRSSLLGYKEWAHNF